MSRFKKLRLSSGEVVRGEFVMWKNFEGAPLYFQREAEPDQDLDTQDLIPAASVVYAYREEATEVEFSRA